MIGLLDHTGTVQATYTSDAWGAHASIGGPDTGVGNHNPWRYSAGLLDPSGLYNFGQRYYQPNLGNWTQQDSIERTADLSQGNRYAYGGQNPVDNRDATGLSIDYGSAGENLFYGVSCLIVGALTSGAGGLVCTVGAAFFQASDGYEVPDPTEVGPEPYL